MKHMFPMMTAVLGLSLTFTGGVLADTGCVKSAKRMYDSCLAESQEEKQAAIAHCINLGDAEERFLHLDP